MAFDERYGLDTAALDRWITTPPEDYLEDEDEDYWNEDEDDWYCHQCGEDLIDCTCLDDRAWKDVR